ncbi:MAG: pilus assembly protein PilP [Gammaproteobacteria bacterium]|nr:pilus assembly protein PilP [Gammaproteobacteria bacterium]MCW8910252.1 pilus assembly protein PilP [Gammaproteobacteria bacterium]MCW9004034.1 pilus assembly protein PilP [Gammaproteobacteria bacterium]MCW9055885.1 pilus assembly protein PilP [Gammaproteobacteria bacterium]
MRTLHKRNNIVLITLCITALTACTQDNSDIHQFIEQTKAKHVGSVKPLPQFKPYKNFTYSANELHDPFAAAFESEEAENANSDSLRPNIQRPKEPLESFPLDTLRMVGILEQNQQVWGLVKDPNNVVHRVQAGNYAGHNEGQIIVVTEQQIDLIEIIPDGLGAYIEREASLAIGSD